MLIHAGKAAAEKMVSAVAALKPFEPQGVEHFRDAITDIGAFTQALRASATDVAAARDLATAAGIPSYHSIHFGVHDSLKGLAALHGAAESGSDVLRSHVANQATQMLSVEHNIRQTVGAELAQEFLASIH